MPCLLSVYQNVDIEASAIQASVLEEVTYAKVMKTGGEQALAKGKQGFKWLANQVGMRPSIDTRPAKSTPELVMQRAAHWRKQPKRMIDQKVLSLLSERLDTPESDLELLSTRIIEEAAAGYGISEDLLLSQQAEAIYRKYLEDCVEGIREQLKKQGQDEINATDRAMAEQLARLSETERLEIQKALNLQTFSQQFEKCHRQIGYSGGGDRCRASWRFWCLSSTNNSHARCIHQYLGNHSSICGIYVRNQRPLYPYWPGGRVVFLKSRRVRLFLGKTED